MNQFITSALWGWFLGWPWYAHAALAGGVVMFLWGALAGLYSLASKLGGWKAGAGALLALGALGLALWPRSKPPDPHEHVTGKDASPPVARRRRPTIFDAFRR